MFTNDPDGNADADEDDENDKHPYNLIRQINDCKWGLPRHFRCFRTRLARPDFSDEILKTMRRALKPNSRDILLEALMMMPMTLIRCSVTW